MLSVSHAAQSLWAKKANDGNMCWLPLVIHSVDTAAVARKIWHNWLPDGVKHVIISGVGDEEITERLLIFLSAAHDTGKATPIFQSKSAVVSYAVPANYELDQVIADRLRFAGLSIKPYREFPYASKTPHALATQLLLLREGCNTNAAVILGAHHGKPPSNDTLVRCGIGVYESNFYFDELSRQAWSNVQQEIINFALRQADISSVEDIPSPNIAAQVLLSGIVIMSDWIASNEDYFPYIYFNESPRSLDIKTRVKNGWNRLNLPSPCRAQNLWMVEDLYKKRFNFEPRKIQEEVADVACQIDDPGILVLEAPMGVGKTEAALVATEIFAYKAGRTGLFFALPTQATTDGIFPRILKWIDNLDDYSKHSVNLVHGKAQLNEQFESLKMFEGSSNIALDEENGSFVYEWFEGSKKSMLADFVVGTIDQLLLAGLKQKHVMLRHLGLANKIVVIDECHAYDAYMSQYLERVLRWLGAYKVPVIVLSATLPAEKRQMVIDAYLNKPIKTKDDSMQYDPLGKSKQAPMDSKREVCNDYPLITYTEGAEVKFQKISIENVAQKVYLEHLEEGYLADKLEDLLCDGGCAGVIVNTVRRAQNIARKLRSRFGDETVRLLHSRFLSTDRIDKEKKLLKELGKPEMETKRPKKRIVVGTQVLEQSLDIDFDVLVSDICPMDLLIQRIGRLHRHQRERPNRLCSAQCFVMGLNSEGFDDGAKIVYGEYLLMRTKAMLPSQIYLPQDIPKLVQDVYDDSLSLNQEPDGYKKAKKRWEKVIADKEERADKFRISRPWPGYKTNMVGMLDTDIPASDKRGEAAVRDTDESIEVLLIQERKGRLCFLPWQQNGREIYTYEVPDKELSRTLAGQSIRLPGVLCTPWAIEKTINELEAINSEQFISWRQSPWLKGELFLVLDEDFSANLCGNRLIYDQNDGLLYEREVETSE